jgi:cell division protein FtsI (penicillin-binding protein 3)
MRKLISNKIYCHDQGLERSLSRLRYIVTGVCCLFLVVVVKILGLGIVNLRESKLVQENKLFNNYIISRADIVDRNGVLLASNIRTASVYVHPNQLIDHANAAKLLANLKIGVSERDLLSKFSSGKDFIWIKRHITPLEQQKIHDLGLPGIYFIKDEKRVYPHENLFAHVLGYMNIDGIGMAGVEKFYDRELKDLDNDFKALELSLDIRIQNILHGELKKSIETHNAIGGAGLVMKVNTGEVVAMVNLPDFNPNNLNGSDKDNLFNQVTLGLYEMGSTFKPFTIAMGLDSKKIKINDAFDVSKPLKLGRFRVNDYKGKGGHLSVPEILIYSSNLGAAQVAKVVGSKTQRDYLKKFGMFNEVSGDISEKARPIFPSERNWSEASLATISYGHGIAVTGMHLAQGMSALVNGGLLYKPTLVKVVEGEKLEYRRVIKEQTSIMMRKLLRLVAANGSAKKANVEGLVVGGKTGTAEKNYNGKYNKKLNLALFAGIFPMYRPEYLVIIMIDEAKPNRINFGYTTGGMIAAPVGGDVIKRMGQILNINHKAEDDKGVLQAMYIDYIPRHVTKLASR